MPFTTGEFFALFAAYNEAVWPGQVLAYLGGFLAVALLLRPSRATAAVIAAVLAAFWAVTGLGYHWTWFATINPIARVFGAVSILQALLLAAAPLLNQGLRFELRADARSALGLALIAYAMAVYPAIGIMVGHTWPAIPMFGIAPCPTTIFTIGMLLLAPWAVARWLLAIPLLWTVVGGSGAVLLSVPQDYGLIVAALVVMGVALRRWYQAGASWRSEPA